MTAIGVMRTSYENGISIGRDLSLVGFDNIPMTEFVLPPLTTIEMSQTELARLAFRALLTEIERQTPARQGSEYVLKTQLVLRESTNLAPTARKPRNEKAKKVPHPEE